MYDTDVMDDMFYETAEGLSEMGYDDFDDYDYDDYDYYYDYDYHD